MHALVDAWNLFFHAREPATTVAAFRIAFGLVLLANAMLLARDLAFLYGPAGAVGDAHRDGAFAPGHFSLLPMLPAGEQGLRLCLAMHIAAAALLTIGCATRLSTIVAFATLISLQGRNPLVTYGGDDVLRVMLFLLMFSRAGDALSVDGWLARGSWRSAEPSSVWCWRLLQLQVSVLYFKAFLSKLKGQTWRDGRAVYLATEVDDFRRRRLPAWARRAGWCKAFAWSTLAIEGALGPLIWIPGLRGAVVVAGVAMHLTLEWFLNLYLFGAVMIACFTLFVDPYVLERWMAAAGIP
jgi:hypothetical protein